MSDFHTPVLLKEAIEGLDVQEGKKYIDATVGGGGHFVEILKRGGQVLGIDQDTDAIEFVRTELKTQNLELKGNKNWKLVRGNFGDIENIAKEYAVPAGRQGFSKVSGILFDLGVSSYQLDTPGRGFSYRFSKAPLDLRLDQTSGETAASLIKRLSSEELYEIFSRFGEEKLARAIARAIVSSRRVSPIQTTGDIVRVVSSVVPNSRDISPTLSRIFQALRIAVNDELKGLKEGLAGSEGLLEKGGRLVVISFHSLEDRIVKQCMKQPSWKILTKKPIVASDTEVRQNIRSRSAKMRIAEKL